MRIRSLRIIVFLSVFSLVFFTAISPTLDVQAVTPIPAVKHSEPVLLTGDFSYTNEFIIETYYVEHAVALVDMHGFVIRDETWEIPLESQTLGAVQIDSYNNRGSYSLQLPARPQGMFNDVNNDQEQDKGVQIFAVAYWPNLSGSPFSESDDRSQGWPGYLASVVVDTANDQEVIGGRLVIWSPDDAQGFPTGFGSDGLLFTADDPMGTIQAGYSIIDLEKDPFAVVREEEPRVRLHEPQDVALKDYSAFSYSLAFEKMFAVVSENYAFNDIEGKAPDWATLYATLAPRIKDAEMNNDPLAFYLALQDFTFAFQDGHVNLDGGDLASQILAERIAGGYGFAIRELDDGGVIVVFVTEDGPADRAGIQVGAELLQFNSGGVKGVIGEVQPHSAPHSTDFSRRYQQARYLLRGSLGERAVFGYLNPGEAVVNEVELLTEAEYDSFSYTSLYHGYDRTALPVQFYITEDGIGYVSINSNFDDLNLMIRLFERTLDTFDQNDVNGIIIDMRQNFGGAWLGLAGFMTDQEILLGQLEYYDPESGIYEPEGMRERIRPFENQYRFDKMALLVDQACFSACEVEAYGFSQLPGMMVVGQYPTAGVEGVTTRGHFMLPEGIKLEIPAGRFTLPDGSLFLEGMGVQPALRVPVDQETVLAGYDVVLQAAVDEILRPVPTGITPEASPQIAGKEDAELALQGGVLTLEERARENYEGANLYDAGNSFIYTIPLRRSEPSLWINGWCADNQEILEENMKNIRLKFNLNGGMIPLDEMAVFDGSMGGRYCRRYYVLLDEWPAGDHHLVLTVSFDASLNDGTTDYHTGTIKYEYDVYVKP